MRSESSVPQNLTTYDVLKSVAVILMIIDHLGWYFFPDDLWFRAVGRWCVPIWFFLIGYAQSRKIDRTWIGGALLLVLADLILGRSLFPLNVLITMLLLRLTMDHVMRFVGQSDTRLVLVTAGLYVAFPITNIYWEYGTLALILAMYGYLARHGFGRMTSVPILYGTACLVMYVVTQHIAFHFSMGQSLLCAVGSGLAIWALFAYLPRREKIGVHIPEPSLLAGSLRFMGRHTLGIYVVHLIVFKAIAFATCSAVHACKPFFAGAFGIARAIGIF